MRLTIIFFFLFLPFVVFSWGFFAHKKINRHAVYSLPPELIGFFKKNIDYITEQAVRPDQRRHSDKDEAPRHYIDADVYGDDPFSFLPKYWSEAVKKIGEDTLKKYGVLPWHIYSLKKRLTNAFKDKNKEYILYLAADLGHYIADAHVPLHTTENYNGQLTGQEGIHALWESRLPELFSGEYSLWVGKAEYVEDVQKAAWDAVKASHSYVNKVLQAEKQLSERYPEDKKYSFESRGNNLVRNYSEKYARAYHEQLENMVENQMKKSIKMIADIWFTCWVDAGQPQLDQKPLELKSAQHYRKKDHSHRKDE